MRKSKLYLSVLASAAMIMSSSVVTMAAETDGTDTASNCYRRNHNFRNS